jgi:hypothetical protein
MTIDIDPIEREPSDLEKFVMEFYGWKRMFYFMQDNREYSVHWTDETIKDFLPSWCVSEYMENHLQKYASIFCRCMYHWERKLHPYWTEELRNSDNYSGTKETPMRLIREWETNSARYWLKNSYEQFCKPLEFVVVKL